jgi:hypothetical protein
MQRHAQCSIADWLHHIFLKLSNHYRDFLLMSSRIRLCYVFLQLAAPMLSFIQSRRYTSLRRTPHFGLYTVYYNPVYGTVCTFTYFLDQSEAFDPFLNQIRIINCNDLLEAWNPHTFHPMLNCNFYPCCCRWLHSKLIGWISVITISSMHR